MAEKALSKTLYLFGKRCPKALWLRIFGRNLAPKDRDTSANIDWQLSDILQFGTEVGKLAQFYFGKGTEVPPHLSLKEKLRRTQGLLEAHTSVIFEATAKDPKTGDYASIDVLLRREDASYDLIEVKSGTSVKERYLDDLCFQYLVFQESGLRIASCKLMTINLRYRRKGALELRKLFSIQDCSDEMHTRIAGIQEERSQLRAYTDGPEPQIAIGPQCLDPHPCLFMGHCGKHISAQAAHAAFPQAQTVQPLNPRILLKEDSAHSMQEQPPPLSQKELKKLQKFLKQISFPLTVVYGYALTPLPIPEFDGTKPYEEIAFCMVHARLEEEGKEGVQTEAFFHDSYDNPKAAFAEALREACGAQACLLSYGEHGFDTVLKRAVASLRRSGSLDLRSIDLRIPFARKSYTHPHLAQGIALPELAALCAPTRRLPPLPQPLTSQYLASLRYRQEEAATFRDACIAYADAMIHVIVDLYYGLSAYCHDHHLSSSAE